MNSHTSDPELGWHLTATWADVRQKAKRIRSEGGVRIIVANAMNVVAHVKGENETYETRLSKVPGRQALAMWECACAWAAYSWGRTGRWRKFEGRQCSHSLATQYEAQARGMFGREVQVDADTPHWLDPMTVRQPGSYDKDTGKHSMKHATGDSDYDYPTHDEFGDLPADRSGVDADPDHALPVAYGDDAHLATRVAIELRRTLGARTAMREFSSAERAALIAEGEGQRARNLSDLQLEGTHYQLMPPTEGDDDLWGF